MGTHPIFESDFDCLTDRISEYNMDVAIKKVRNGIDGIFDKTLQDLVRGVRNNKGKEKEYISQAVEDIREELKHPHCDVKAVAISKLCFLQMLGYEMGWAAF